MEGTSKYVHPSVLIQVIAVSTPNLPSSLTNLFAPTLGET